MKEKSFAENLAEEYGFSPESSRYGCLKWYPFVDRGKFHLVVDCWESTFERQPARMDMMMAWAKLMHLKPVSYCHGDLRFLYFTFEGDNSSLDREFVRFPLEIVQYGPCMYVSDNAGYPHTHPHMKDMVKRMKMFKAYGLDNLKAYLEDMNKRIEGQGREYEIVVHNASLEERIILGMHEFRIELDMQRAWWRNSVWKIGKWVKLAGGGLCY